MKKLFLTAIALCTLMWVLPRFAPPAETAADSHAADSSEIILRDTADEDIILYILTAYDPRIMPDEALYALAVGGRTTLSGGFPADILTEGQARDAYGSGFDAAYERAEKAVSYTDGVTLTYCMRPVNAVYHLSDGGMTASAEEVTGKAVPYLVSADSYGAETEEITMTACEVHARLSAEYGTVSDSGGIDTVSSPSGYVQGISLCGVTISGEEAARILNLPSAMFTAEVSGSDILFTVSGSGHGMGMSISGACAMADMGYGYEEILTHYYCGTEVTEKQSRR